MLTSSNEPASNRISFLKIYQIAESRILKFPHPFVQQGQKKRRWQMTMLLCFWYCVTGFTTVLDSIVGLLKIAFLEPATYIFHSGCLKRCLGFVEYFRYLLSNSTEDPQNQNGASAFHRYPGGEYLAPMTAPTHPKVQHQVEASDRTGWFLLGF